MKFYALAFLNFVFNTVPRKYDNQNPGTYTMYYSNDTSGNTMEVSILIYTKVNC